MMTTNMGRVESAARQAIDASLAPGVVLTCLGEDAGNDAVQNGFRTRQQIHGAADHGFSDVTSDGSQLGFRRRRAPLS